MVKLDLVLAVIGYAMMVSGTWLVLGMGPALFVGGLLLLGSVLRRVKA